MNNNIIQETICAIASPPGNGAIAIIRISGNDALTVISQIFYVKGKIVEISQLKPNRAMYGEIRNGEIIVDEVIVTSYIAPYSYTGENSIEISCHGSEFIQKEIMRLLLLNNVRLAQAGEFTMRAFLNGKMDLSQAEAVADLIASDSAASHRVALQQLRGGIKNELQMLRIQLLQFSSLIELELDFSEDDVEFADREHLKQHIVEIKNHLLQLIQSFSKGNAMKSGISVVIAGPVNAGKSTLLNAFLNEERAIVSDIPGTTRDVVEDTIHINGIKVRFADTAGLRVSSDTIENLGIERTYDYAKRASLILFLTTPENNRDDINEMLTFFSKQTPEVPIILIINKTENIVELQKHDLLERFSFIPAQKSLFISAKFKQGLNLLQDTILEVLNLQSINNIELLISNVRHLNALNLALDACHKTLEAFQLSYTTDIIAFELQQINHHLGEVTGQISHNEVLKNIFANFCIGK